MARLCSLVFVTLAVDGFMVTYCLENISMDRASALVLFAFGELPSPPPLSLATRYVTLLTNTPPPPAKARACIIYGPSMTPLACLPRPPKH